MDLTKRDYVYFDLARKMARISSFKKGRVGCVVVYRKSILAMGYSAEKTHPMQEKYNKYRFSNGLAKIHAEIMALNQIKYSNIDFSKVKVYNYRIRLADGADEIGMSRPCSSCMQFIKDLGIKKVFYTTNGGYCYEYIE